MTKIANHDRRRFLRALGITTAACSLGFTSPVAASLFGGSNMPSLDGASGWLNSQPLKKADLRGKIILIDFWTYSCINWRRTLPYLRAWDKKYRQRGLIVIGVHTPEFAFEHEIENVRQAVKEMKIEYPVALDNEYAVWRAFGNNYWPALYLADSQGHMQYHKFGEGDYERLELAIQQLLKKAGAKDTAPATISLDPAGPEAAADWNDLKSEENYLGYERTENFASSGGLLFDKDHNYILPDHLKLNHWALAGNWTALKQAIVLHAAHGRIAYQFHARDLHLVMSPAARGETARFLVRIDGEIPGAAHGTDIDAQGSGAVSEPRMYHLIRQPKPISDRKLEIEFLDPGVQAFSFTFG